MDLEIHYRLRAMDLRQQAELLLAQADGLDRS